MGGQKAIHAQETSIWHFVLSLKNRLTRCKSRTCLFTASGDGQILACRSLMLISNNLLKTCQTDAGKHSRHHQLSPGEATARKLLAGGLAGAVSKTVVAPLERLTTIMMADMPHDGFRKSLKRMWSDGGFWGLFSGNTATLAKIFPQTAIQFAAFYTLKDVLSLHHQGQRDSALARDINSLEHLLVGSVAGLLACSATYPLDTMRTQMSVTGGLKGSLLSVGSQIISTQGFPALYKGFSATLTSDMLGSGLGFMNYEIGTRLYRKLNDGRYPNAPEKGIIGAVSASITLTLIMPLEVVRRRLQVQGSCGREIVYKGTLDALVKIWQTGGVSSFYSAALSNYLKVAPSIGSVYFLYDYFSAQLGVDVK